MRDPGAVYYRTLWTRLAAEANETTPEQFERLVHVESAAVTCPFDCMLEVHYTFQIGWLVIPVTDQMFVHGRPRSGAWPAAGDTSWYTEVQIRDDVTNHVDHIASDTVSHSTLTLAFASRDDAVAAFVRMFGHEPAQRTAWAIQAGKGMPTWEHPSFEYDSPADACVGDHVLDLVTGTRYRSPYRFCR